MMYNKVHALLVFFILLLLGCNEDNNSSAIANIYVSVPFIEIIEDDSIIFDSLNVTDPYIIADESTKMYYMTGTGGLLWKSHDLHTWKGPNSFIEIDTTCWMGSNPKIWAPQLHKYKNKYYCLVTFTNPSIIVESIPERYNVLRRNVHILVADKAEGPYRPINEEGYLPIEWSTLDGTLWEEGGALYLIFNHDWMQLVDGQIKCIRLADDLSESLGMSKILFSASDAKWAKDMKSIGELTFGMALNGYVSDGPFLFRTGTERLGMLWSSWSDKRYTQGVAYSETGLLAGPWIQEDKPILDKNSGHGMLFNTFDGKALLLLHSQGLELNPGPRKPVLYEVDFSGDFITIGERYHPKSTF